MQDVSPRYIIIARRSTRGIRRMRSRMVPSREDMHGGIARKFCERIRTTACALCYRVRMPPCELLAILADPTSNRFSNHPDIVNREVQTVRAEPLDLG
jgi:hypothetical protein